MTKKTADVLIILSFCILVLSSCFNSTKIQYKKRGELGSDSYNEELKKPDVLVESILDKYIFVMGGEKILEKLTSRWCKGKWIQSYNPQDDIQEVTPFESIGTSSTKWTVTYNSSTGDVRYGSNGKTGWRQNPDRIEQDPGMIRARLGFIMNPQGALYIRDNLTDLKLKGEEAVNDRSAYVIGTEEEGSPYGDLYFDTQTGLLIKIGSNWEIQGYHEVDGTKFPYRIIVRYRSGSSGAFCFDKIEHNTPVKSEIFDLPSHKDLFAAAFQGIDDPKVLPMLTTEDLTYVHEDMNVPCNDGRFLYDLILENNYKQGLEIGTFTGYSTLWMALALKKTGGNIITIEIDPGPGEVAKQNFKKAGLSDIIDVRISDALQEIPKLEGKFDFVFIDAWKPDYIQYLKLIRDRILPGGAIIAHNVTNYARDMKDFIDTIQNDPGLDTTFHEISAEGFSLSIVRK